MKIKFCLYCGKEAEAAKHDACDVMIRKVAADMAASPKKERFTVMQAAEAGTYSLPKKEGEK